MADLNLDCHKSLKLTHKRNEHSIRNASALKKQSSYALQHNASNNSQGLGPGATAHNPPDPHSFLFNCLRGGGVAWCGHLKNFLP